MRPAALRHRVARLEAAAARQGTPTIRATIAAILDGQGPRVPIGDEELSRFAVGRLLLERRRRAGISHLGPSWPDRLSRPGTEAHAIPLAPKPACSTLAQPHPTSPSADRWRDAREITS
jgi:hypothetical protein